MSEITWGMPVVLDLFFAGLAAGAFCFAVLASRRAGESYQACARSAAFLAPLSVAFGLSMLVLDLRFKTRFWFTMTVFNGESPMSVGAWLLMLFSVIATLYAIFWIPAAVRERLPVIGRWPLWSQQKVRETLGLAGIPVALLVSIYTGVLLSATSIPLWRNLALPALFCFSSMTTGFAAGLLLALLFFPGKRQEIITGPFRWLQGSYRVLLPAYLLAILVYFLLFFIPGIEAGRSVVPDRRMEGSYLVVGCGRGRHHPAAFVEWEKGAGKPFQGFYCPRCCSGRGDFVTVGTGLYRPGAYYRCGISSDVYAVNKEK